MHLQTLKCPASSDERLWERHASPVIQLPPSLVRFFQAAMSMNSWLTKRASSGSLLVYIYNIYVYRLLSIFMIILIQFLYIQHVPHGFHPTDKPKQR